MATIISHNGRNSGFQAGVINGNVTTQFVQSQTLNQACLRDLRTTNPHDDKDRIQSSNGGLLKDCFKWILDNEEFHQWRSNQSRRLWIRGDPGKGKTMLLCGIIDELTRSFGDTANISFFFCQATDVRINNATAVLRGLIYLLVQKQPSLLSHIQSQYDQAGKALFEDINAWNALSRIFMDILRDATLRSTYLIIDALDECTTSLPSLLDLLAHVSSDYPHVKWIVSSRNWPDIEERLDTTQTAPISLELNEASVSEAVSRFIQHKVHHLAKAKKYINETRDTICRHLLSNSQGTFLWVALVCQELGRTSRWHALKKLEVFPPGLDALYGRMINQVRNSEDAEPCKRILAVMSIVYRPIVIDELASLVELPDDLSNDSEALSEIIAICGSFLTMSDDTIIFVHQSAKEFLIRETQNGVFPQEAHGDQVNSIAWSQEGSRLASASSDKTVRIWDPATGHSVFTLEAHSDRVNSIAWSQDGSRLASASDDKTVRIWDPATGHSMFTLEAHSDTVWSIAWSPDGGRLASGSWDSTVRIWDPATGHCVLTFKAHSDKVESIAWSPDGSRLASESTDNTIRIWDLATSQYVLILKGFTEVESITWSQDGSQLASASGDNTVRIWDPATGHCMLILKGHSDWATSITWSQDGSRLASGSYDRTVRIWDPTTGQSVLTLEGHSDAVSSIAWSQDGSRLASGSWDSTVRIWDPTTGQCVLILEGHSDWVNSITWSQDGSRLASASSDKTVRIWDPATGQYTSTLEGHGQWVTSIAWSQDGSLLASALGYDESRPALEVVYDETVRLWDPATGQCVSTLKMYDNDPVSLIAWSRDGSRLAAGSYKSTISIWDPATGQCTSFIKIHNGSVESITWSQDGSRLASASLDDTVRIWDPATGQCVSILKGHSNSIRSIAWSQDESRLASASADNTVRIWDPATGQCVLILEGHSDWVNSITWSQDGSRLASASNDKTVRIWDPATGQCTSILEGHSNSIRSIAWSQDGSRLASASDDKTARIWDSTTGQCESTLHISSPFRLQFDKLNFNHLQTSNGTFEIKSASPITSTPHVLTPPEQCGYGLNNDHSWVTYNGVNLLWLPAEFRRLLSPFFAMSAMTLAIGCSSGRVIFLGLGEQIPIAGP
ncbi:hypothetical protein N7540_005973 [Penicillium herquei]|nr:hypothetical protein N7540_005973 [Penicillium herquei]